MKTKHATPFLSIVKPDASQDVIESLEYVLDRARRGEVLGLVYVAQLTHGRHLTDRAGESGRSPANALGQVHLLADELVRRIRGE